MKQNKKKITIVIFIVIQMIIYLTLVFSILFPDTKYSTVCSTLIITLFLISFYLLFILWQYMLELSSLKAANQALMQHIKMRQEHLIVQEENHK